MQFPSGLKYTKDHEWLDAQATTATVGVTAYAIDQLGDIVHVELPQVGETFDAGAAFGTIESTKTVSDLYMPVGGKVVEVNKAAVGQPESLQADPYKNGWLVKIEFKGKLESAQLLDAKAYEKYVAENAD
jgi:glycine cleavage system H protein